MRRVWLVVLGALTASVGTLAAQDAAADKARAFEVVSIRQNTSGNGPRNYGPTASGWHMTNMPMGAAIAAAYGPVVNGMPTMSEMEVIGLPDWTKTERYDIEAKVAEADVAAWQAPASQDAMSHAMLQQMLAERCKMAAHRETRELATYWLETGKALSLKETDAKTAVPAGQTMPGGGVVVPGQAGEMHFYGISTATVGAMLAKVLGRPVVDKTD